MFTGIVRGLCKITKIVDLPGQRKMTVALNDWSADLEIGASVSINGTCLSAVAIDKGEVSFDLIQETLERTNLGKLEVGYHVNIERAARVGDEIGGHHVMGHIDTVGTIQQVIETENNREVFVQHDPQWNKFMVPKGWIAIDGISLTVVAVEADRFSVCLIPETLGRTTLGFKQKGHEVNLEFDQMTKVIVQTVERLNQKS